MMESEQQTGRTAPPPLADKATVADPLLNQEVGKYLVTRRIGSGGMGVVYEARVIATSYRVALKVLKPKFAPYAHYGDLLLAEARKANLAQNDGIAKAISFERLPNGIPYIVMEYVEGETFDAFLKGKGGQLDYRSTLKLARQIASSISAAHAVGILHRDLKPNNIMVSREQYTKILDFGLSDFISADEELENEVLTQSLLLEGTPRYMAPEQWKGAKLDGQTDVYAVGFMLYEMLAGKPPFQGKSTGDWSYLHTEQTPPPLDDVCPTVTREMAAFVGRMLAKSPKQRPTMRQSEETFGELLALLAQQEAAASRRVREEAEARLQEERSRRTEAEAKLRPVSDRLREAEDALQRANQEVKRLQTVVSERGDKIERLESRAQTLSERAKQAQKTKQATSNPWQAGIIGAVVAVFALVAGLRNEPRLRSKLLRVEASEPQFSESQPPPSTAAPPKPQPPQPAPAPAPAQPPPKWEMDKPYLLSRGGSMLFIPIGGTPAQGGSPSGILMDRTEVTVAEYTPCVTEKVCPQVKFENMAAETQQLCNWLKPDIKGKHPMNCITFDEAKKYCEWAGKRLPTAAEWEFAAVGTDGSRHYPWGNNEPVGDNQPCWNVENPGTCEVGTSEFDSSPFKILDMAGNVQEWVDEDYDDTHKKFRGGNWHSDELEKLLPKTNHGLEPWKQQNIQGFRCVVNISKLSLK